MADDEADWFGGGDDEPAAPEPAAAAAAAAPAAGGEAPAAGEGAPAEGEAPAPEEAEPEAEFLDPDKLLLFKHWIRPKFLPYKYLFNYRHNYYDDVIDYLDKRQRGIKRDIPVAQTWAERTLRYYNNRSNQQEVFKIKRDDKKLVEETKVQGLFQLHHSRNYISRRYLTISSC